MRLRFCFVVFLTIFSRPVHSIDIKLLRTPKISPKITLNLELFWKKTIENHFHNATSTKETPLSPATAPLASSFTFDPPTRSSWHMPTLHDAAPLYDTFMGRPKEREDDRLDNRHAKTMYIQVDVNHKTSSSATTLKMLSSVSICLALVAWSLL